jgi:hypothetical protein
MLRGIDAHALGNAGLVLVSWFDFPAGATREEIDDVLARAKAKGATV